MLGHAGTLTCMRSKQSTWAWARAIRRVGAPRLHPGCTPQPVRTHTRTCMHTHMRVCGVPALAAGLPGAAVHGVRAGLRLHRHCAVHPVQHQPAAQPAVLGAGHGAVAGHALPHHLHLAQGAAPQAHTHGSVLLHKMRACCSPCMHACMLPCCTPRARCAIANSAGQSMHACLDTHVCAVHNGPSSLGATGHACWSALNAASST